MTVNGCSALALSLALASIASCDGTDRDPNELTGDVGPAGGTLRGQVGSQFEGVELAIPAGALAAPTHVRIVPTIDATPLPALALRVGTQFALEPAGTTLATPAMLTLPVSADTVQHFGQADGDVKVWVRDGDAWSLAEPSATAPGSVTIAVSSFATAAAGVRLVITGPACSTCRPILASGISGTSSACTSATGFCSRSLGIPAEPPTFPNLAIDSSAVYYPVEVFQGATGPNIAIARLDFSSGVVTKSPGLPFAAAAWGLAVDMDGSVWAGLSGHLGNARFSFGGAVTRYDFDGTNVGQGAIRTPAGRLIRFLRSDTRGWLAASRVGGVGTLFRSIPLQFLSPFSPLIAGTDASPGVDAYFVSVSGGGEQRIDAATGSLLGLVGMEGPAANIALRVAATTDGTASVPPTLATITYTAIDSTNFSIAMAYAPSGSALHAVGLPFMPYDLDSDFGVSGGVWIVGNTAEIHYLAPDGGLTSAPLTAETDATSTAYALSVPLAVRGLAGGSCVVLLRSGQFLIIRRAT